LAKKIWQIRCHPVTFAPVLYNLLIKKGRGIWPGEALATNNVNWEGANSSPVIQPGKISQITASCHY